MEPKTTTNKASFNAEIIQSNLQSFAAQCWKWNDFPRFGTLVQSQNGNILIVGCITQVDTGSSDPMHMPFPYQKTEAELLAEQPQIFEFLRTIFTVQILGYYDIEQNKFFHILPPSPCKIHSFVKECDYDLNLMLFQEPYYLNILFANSNQISNLDELLLAMLHELSRKKALTKQILEEFCQSFSLLTRNDYCRLKMFLGRIEKLVKSIAIFYALCRLV
jgi:hypothetical protein